LELVPIAAAVAGGPAPTDPTATPELAAELRVVAVDPRVAARDEGARGARLREERAHLGAQRVQLLRTGRRACHCHSGSMISYKRWRGRRPAPRRHRQSARRPRT